jgi:ATP-binding cassette subfamily B protein RaxB
MIVSAETTECGLACLAMVAVWHGHRLDLNSLRQRYALSSNGTSLRTVMDIAARLQLATRAIRVEVRDLSRVPTPAILHWDLKHFVVLERTTRRGLIIHDPSIGRREITWDLASVHFTGVALELSPTADFEPVNIRETLRLRSLWSRLDGFWSSVAYVAGLSVLLQVLAFAPPLFLQLATDRAVLSDDRRFLLALCLGFGGVTLLQASIEAVRTWTLQVVGQLANFQITANLVHHLIRLNLSYFERRQMGDIMSRLASARGLQDLLTRGIASSILDGLMAVLAAAFLFLYSAPLAAVVVASMLIYGAAAYVIYPLVRRSTEEQLSESANEQTTLMEIVRGVATIRLLGREPEREGNWRNAYARVTSATVAAARWQVSLQFVQSAVAGLQLTVVVFVGAVSLLSKTGITLGMFVAFLALRQTFTDRATSLITQSLQLRLLGLHLARMSDIVHAPREIDAAGEDFNVVAPQGAIELEDVWYRYSAVDRSVLRGLNLRIQPGEFVAITGPSGGGKTTLLRIVLGLSTPTEGRLLLDGLEATPGRLRAWREHVGSVRQDDRLFGGSLAENIAFFDADLDMARVVSAARAALIHDDIVEMPMQYLTFAGDMGVALSSGQVQRVILARALYRNPKILVLDEGTANLDVEAEATLAQAIRNMPITRLVVAHRSALLGVADRVVELRDGALPALEPKGAARVN